MTNSGKNVLLVLMKYIFWIGLCAALGMGFTTLIFYSDITSKVVEECWSVALAEKVNCDSFKMIRALSGVVPGAFIGFLIAKKTGRS